MLQQRPSRNAQGICCTHTISTANRRSSGRVVLIEAPQRQTCVLDIAFSRSSAQACVNAGGVIEHMGHVANYPLHLPVLIIEVGR